MRLFPDVKDIKYREGYCIIEEIRWIMEDNTDIRVKKTAERIKPSCASGFPIYVRHDNKISEKYSIKIEKNAIYIIGDGPAGAFYGLTTLKKLIEQNGNRIECCDIVDYPDMQYRGFYQDITRGRIPKMETLKKLVDIMAEYKLNSLQLYVEHCFEFKEYEFCREKLGYITAEEIRELDEYCKDRFIDLVPSLSCFGHLYHLLQSDKYKHLSELKDYQPTQHHFIERMFHHTINPLLDESFELITGLIDQHMEAFSSEYFNICCDETFDLGKDVNSDKDKGDLYVGFVNKLSRYVQSKGKKVMMWGDIVLHHKDKLSELPDDIIFLNWSYDKEPEEKNIELLKDKIQIVCPGTSSWYGFSERTNLEEDNILKMAEFGYKYGAIGMLNTNWGDLGNLASIDMSMYGLLIGAISSWDKDTGIDIDFKKEISLILYGNIEAIEILDVFGDIERESNWRILLEKYDIEITVERLIYAANECSKAIERIKEMPFSTDNIKNEFLLAAEGYALIIKWHARQYSINVVCNVDFESWLENYRRSWLNNSKKSELEVLTDLLCELEKK